jgi:hypothetical protein
MRPLYQVSRAQGELREKIMSGEHDNVEHSIDFNEVGILEILVRNAIDRQTKERPESINELDFIDESFHKLLEKLGRC